LITRAELDKIAGSKRRSSAKTLGERVRGAHLRERVQPLIWRESGSGTRAIVESVLKDSGVNPRKLDQRFELGNTEVIKSLVIAGLGVGFFSCWEIQQEIAMGLVRQNIFWYIRKEILGVRLKGCSTAPLAVASALAQKV
jgi:DNA-binding transcriptional LysR family regulator